MKKYNSALAFTMMEMRMWACCMHMTFRPFLSDMFSNSKAKLFAA